MGLLGLLHDFIGRGPGILLKTVPNDLTLDSFEPIFLCMTNEQYIASRRPGQMITFRIPNGLGRNGIEWKTKKAKIVLAEGTHVVVNMGGQYGQPGVVTPQNVIQ